RKLGIEKASVVGVSEGGMIVQYLAIDHANLVDRLVIAVSAPNANEIVRTVVSSWIESAKQGNHKQLMIDTAEKSYTEENLKRYRKTYPVIGWIGKPKNYHRFLVNANAILHFDCFDDLKKITCPTLIIGGETDQIVGPIASYEMHEQIKGSELYMYEKFGHAAYEEATDFNKRVYDFLVR
ncbi:MAG: hydrolase, partial [Clostridiales bacterium]|nr:hydrolase [Clostridiales bacterium]